MNIKNINRAKEIATDLPILEGALKQLSDKDNKSAVWVSNGTETFTLPEAINNPLKINIQILIDILREEVEKL